MALLLLAGACGGDSGGPPPPPPEACSGGTAITLAPGANTLLDASSVGCLRFPAAGAGGAEYLVAVLAAPGLQVTDGLSTGYTLLLGGPDGSALRAPQRVSAPDPDLAQSFHDGLRAREAELAHTARLLPRQRRTPALVAPPTVGSSRTFQVCAQIPCTAFVSVTATARFVGLHGAIYLDDDLPAPGFAQADVDTLGPLFDQYLYPIDTTAFGRESDIDGNGVVAILLTDAVNALSGNCVGTGLISGYFFGNDLVPGNPGSNAGEVFYSFVPDATRPGCQLTRDRVLRFLPPTLIHELQHMISFHQHVLVAGGETEHTWLNEALSHFAEELGARLIPNGPGMGDAPTRQTQFVLKDLENAYDYLSAPEQYFLVTPGSSLGRPPERGANWLFVRWLLDHYGSGVQATPLTRALVATQRQGADNVSALAGRPFEELVAEWQLANYLDDLPGFVPGSPRLAYLNLNLRTTLIQVFPVFPLRPDAASAGYTRNGTLRAGSARHVLIVQGPDADAQTLSITAPGGALLPAGFVPRVAVARIR